MHLKVWTNLASEFVRDLLMNVIPLIHSVNLTEIQRPRYL
jgi:hypothetical protein